MSQADFNFDNLSFEETILVEDKLDMSVDEIGEYMRVKSNRKGAFLAAMAWIVARRTNPGISYDEAIKTMRLSATTDGTQEIGPSSDRPFSPPVTDESPSSLS